MDNMATSIVVAATILSVAYVFVRSLSLGFVKALLATSMIVDFALIIFWLLGIDRPVLVLYFSRTRTSITITALTLALPFKLLFTLYLFIKQREISKFLS